MKYLNTSSYSQVIPNIGHVLPGETIETTEVIENINFKLVVDKKEEKKVPSIMSVDTPYSGV